MTFEHAAVVLDRHFIQWRACPEPDSIAVLSEYTHRDHPSQVFTEWVTLPLDRNAIFDWLGY